MLGNSSDLTSAAGEGTAGLIPRICVELFQRFGLASGGGSVGVAAADSSCRGNGRASIQIYNEQVRDLFGHGGNGHGLRVREHPTKGAFVEGLSARPVASYQQVQQLLEDGMSARATAATAMNEVSSRSHAIFTVHITVTMTTKLSHGGGGEEGKRGSHLDGEADDDARSRASKICLVDLAGSERANATGAKGDRLREAANINKSLSTLGDVIKALAKRGSSGRGAGGAIGGVGGSNNESFIPYRNSMLTWLLKDSIGGNSKTVMLAAISPVADAYQETMSTLRYVERAKEIVNSVALNDANTNPLVGKLREEVRALQELLEAREATIAEHEGKEVTLTAALERARAGDDDKVLRALADADELQAALQAEKRDKEKVKAVAAKDAEAERNRHARELKDQSARHAADFDECLKQHEQELTRAREEAAQMLAFEVGLVRDQAAEEKTVLQQEWAQSVELEGTKLATAQARADELAAALERHQAETDKLMKEAAGSAACAAEAASSEISALREKHAREIAKNSEAAEQAHAEEIRRLRETFETEKETARMEAREARKEEELAELQARTEAVAAAAEEAREAALKDLRQRHESSLASLSEAHGVAVKSAVEEGMERLRVEHRKELAAAETAAAAEAGALTHKEAGLREALRSEKDRVAALDVAISALRVDHETELASMKSASEEALEKRLADADAKLAAHLREAAGKTAAVEAESARAIEALKDAQGEQLASALEKHQLSLRRAVEEARANSEAELASMASKSAAAVELAKAEAEAARTSQEHKHREEIRAVGEQLEAEIKVLVADSEHREREALETLAGQHEASMTEARAQHEQQVEALHAEHAEQLAIAEKRWREDAQAAATDAETRRMADLEEAEARAGATLAAERERHRDEIRRIRTEIDSKFEHAVADTKEEHEAAIATLRAKHSEALNLSSKQRREIERLAADSEQARQTAAREYKEQLAAALSEARAEAAEALASKEAQHEVEMRLAQEGHKTEITRVKEVAEGRRESDLTALRRQLAQAEATIKDSCEAVKRQTATHGEKMEATIADLKSAHQAELTRLREEHAASVFAAAANAEEQRAADVADAENQYKSSVEAARKEMAEEKAKFVSRHLLEMRKVKEDSAGELQRAVREADERGKAQGARAAAKLNEAKEAHARDLQAASASAEEARKAELEAVNDQLASTTSKLKSEMADTIAKLKEQHRREIRTISEEKEAEHESKSAAAAELHAKAIADAETSHKNALQEALQVERSSHTAAISAIEASVAAAEADRDALRETLESEHRVAVDALEQTHRAAMMELEERERKKVEELEERVEAAQAAAADAQASADELATRADVLDEMLKASVGSNEQELAGHRSRVAQLQGFVARREAARDPSSSAASGGDGKNTLSPPVVRSLQQRFSDLRAMAAGAGVDGTKVAAAGGKAGIATFLSSASVEGLTIENYAEELEVVLVRATVEAAAARQDHLEADLQFQSVTRQLVGLKLVHAQLRESLEDTQVKLEHKSQSAARRLLNSAARLYTEFAKPDRFSSSSRPPGSPRSTKPRAMSSQSSGGRSPLSRTRGGAVWRGKSRERDRQQEMDGVVPVGVSTEKVVVDFTATS
eukprot:g15626.t1